MTNLKKEIEEERAMLQTYLASDMDIDKMDFNEVVNYAVEEIQDGSNIFLGHWKDYAFLRGKLEGYQQALLSQKQEFEKIIDNLPIDVQKDYKTKKVRILIDKKELKSKVEELK
jgi:hypothetical protein